jgi:hypothetical protein
VQSRPFQPASNHAFGKNPGLQATSDNVCYVSFDLCFSRGKTRHRIAARKLKILPCRLGQATRGIYSRGFQPQTFREGRLSKTASKEGRTKGHETGLWGRAFKPTTLKKFSGARFRNESEFPPAVQ